MLHFHVSHLAGLFKEKQCSCCQWYNCCVGALGSLHTSEWWWLIPAAVLWAAMNSKWHWGKNRESYRSSKDRRCDTYQSPSSHCLSTMHWKFALCSWWLHNCPQLWTQGSLSNSSVSTASNPPTAVCLQESWEQNSILTFYSKAFVWLLSRVSSVCQVSLPERPQ